MRTTAEARGRALSLSYDRSDHRGVGKVFWWDAPAPADPRTAEELPDDDGDGCYDDDAGVDTWLPGLVEAREDR